MFFILRRNSSFAVVRIFLLVAFFSSLTVLSQQGTLTTEYHHKKLKKSEGELLNGLKNGVWKYWSDEGRLKKIETYHIGVLDGLYETFIARSDYEMDSAQFVPVLAINYKYFLNQQKSEVFRDSLISGFYQNGVKQGLWIERPDSDTGKIYRRMYENGLLNGSTKIYTSYRTLLYDISYVNNVRNGPCSTYTHSGDLRRVENYENDTLKGKFKLWDKPWGVGDLIVGSQYNGILHGEVRKYDGYGKLCSKENYVMGELDGPAYYRSNQYELTYTYSKGQKSGPYSFFCTNFNNYSEHGFFINALPKITGDFEPFRNLDTVRVYGEYINSVEYTVNILEPDSVPIVTYGISGWGKTHGKFTLYRYGRLSFEGFFKEGQPDSAWIYYDEKGQISERRIYEIETDPDEFYLYGTSICVQHWKNFPSGKREFDFDLVKGSKVIYWPNGKLRAKYQIGDTPIDSETEQHYDESGKLCLSKVYNFLGEFQSEKKYCGDFEPEISADNDEHLSGYFSEPMSVDEVMIDVGDGDGSWVDDIIEPMFEVVSEEPRFSGGPDELMRFIERRYWHDAKSNDGLIRIRFIVERDGNVDWVKIWRDQVGNGHAVELADIVRSAPSWMPGKEAGKSVRSEMELRCTFLKGERSYEVEMIAMRVWE